MSAQYTALPRARSGAGQRGNHHGGTVPQKLFAGLGTQPETAPNRVNVASDASSVSRGATNAFRIDVLQM